jgi:threonine/homoserine/homoserine lactone efflux protein
MFEAATLFKYAAAALALLITPGPAVIYIVSRSIDQGRKAGILSNLGIALGTLPHAFAVALGVAALLASSLVVFSLLKYLGAAYLIYLGVCRILQKNSDNMLSTKSPRSGTSAFFQSIGVGFLNPKTVLFFMAFLPQFVDPARGNPMLQTLLLWAIFESLGITVGSTYALMAGGIRQLLIKNKTFSTAGRYLTGSVYIGLGLAAALTGSKNK